MFRYFQLVALLFFFLEGKAQEQDTTLFMAKLDEILRLPVQDVLNVSTASKVQQDIRKAPGVITVMDREEIEAFGGNSLFELLDRATGIFATGTYSNPQNMKQSIITAFLGRTQDRFSEYQEPTSLEERLDLVVKIPGVDGVEIVYPYETEEAGVTKKMFNDRGLNFAAINANIKKETQWVPGALSRSNPDIRQGAIEIIKKAKDYAKAVGAPLVTCCPLSDGYDNLFQVDYPKAWRNMVEAVAEAADYLPEVPLFIEYKINETRVHAF